MQQNKYLEYFLDSRIYNHEDVQKSIEETKKEFSNKEIEVRIELNEFNVYIITFKFEDKDTYLNRIKWKKNLKNPLVLMARRKNKSRLEKYYQETKTYRPY